MPEKSAVYSIVKALNYICAVAMFGTALVRYSEYDAKIILMDGFYLAFTFYLFIFGILLAAAEYEVVHILKYIEFLITQTGKGLFLIFIGVLLFDNRRAVDLWASLSLTLVGIFNLMVTCFPTHASGRSDSGKARSSKQYQGLKKQNMDLEESNENQSLLSYYDKQQAEEAPQDLQ